MFKSILFLIAFFFLFGAAPSLAQQPAQPVMKPEELKSFIQRARLGTSEYTTKFKDVTAAEDQKIEEYDQLGKLQRQRLIASDLIIYQSQLDPTQMIEYRDVKSVDGVAIKKREQRLLNLLNKAAKAGTVKKELDRLIHESRRYDRSVSFHGETLNQGLPLVENARDYFDFKFVGRERIDGHDSIVIDYQQLAQSPHMKFDFEQLPGPLKGAQGFYRGRLWLDAETAQLRREMREMTLQPRSLDLRLVMFRFDFEYADSRFGFLTPQRIVITSFTRGRTGADKKPELLLGLKITFQYGAFTRFDVEKPDASIAAPVKP